MYIKRYEDEYMRHQWALYVRQGIRRRIEMQAFDELDRYIKRLVDNLQGYPEHINKLVEILRQESPQHAGRVEKLLLLL